MFNVNMSTFSDLTLSGTRLVLYKICTMVHCACSVYCILNPPSFTKRHEYICVCCGQLSSIQLKTFICQVYIDSINFEKYLIKCDLNK